MAIRFISVPLRHMENGDQKWLRPSLVNHPRQQLYRIRAAAVANVP
jgi:hypothetical protein